MLHSLEAETYLVAAWLVSTAAQHATIDSVTPDIHFHDARLGAVASVCQAMYRAGKHVDLSTVTIELRNLGLLDKLGGPGGIADIALASATPSQAEYYLSQLQEYAIRRQLVTAADTITKTASDTAVSLSDVVSISDAAVSKALDTQGVQKPITLYDGMCETFASIDDRRNNGTAPGVATGFRAVDDILVGGLAPGNLVVIAARPAMGKSAFMLGSAWHVADAGGVAVVFSLEMTRHELYMRLYSCLSGIAHHRILTGNLNDSEYTQLIEVMELCREKKLFVFDMADASPAVVAAKCKRIAHEQGRLDCVDVDYLQRMNLETGRRQDNRNNQIEAATWALKTLAKQLQVPVKVYSQLSRAVEQRDDKRPRLSDLRDSGAIEQDCDKALFLYRGGYYYPEMDEGDTEVIVAKHRSGRLGTANLWLNLKTTAFMEVA